MKHFFLSVALLLTVSSLFAQQHTCGTMQHHQMLLQQDPKLADRMKDMDNHAQQFAATWQYDASRAVITIPVVVHVVYNTSVQNISDAQIQTQIDRLNQDFRKLNTDWTNTPSVWQSLVADAQIEFCLATRDPNGNPTNGIVRKQTSTTAFSLNDNVKYNNTGGSSAWPASSYLNLWVCNLSGTTLGYAQLPGGPAASDGVVISYKYFGQTGTATAPFNKGRTATHEVGHWLGLYHIWGDDGTSCSGSDQVSDTPNQADENYGCPNFPTTSCSNGPNGDMFMNYMDYVDDACMYMFTNGQSARMNSFLSQGGARFSLLSSLGCQGTTTAPVANFTGTPTSVCPGQTVQFTSTSTGSITSYSWSFAGGNPSTSTAQNPTVTYSAAGTYGVTLTVTGPNGSDSEIKTAYITVSNANALPLQEGFESATFPPAGWTITNGDGATTWVRTTSASGFNASTASAYVNCYNYQTTNQKDWLITPSYNFTGVTNGRLRWDYAYAPYNQSGYADSLTVLVSTNCGSTWSTLWTRGGTSLGTATATGNQFVPTQASQWRKDSVALTNLSNQSNVRFAFVTTNRYGNNIFLDNVNLFSVTQGGGSAPVADFVGTPTTVVAGNSVAFTDLSTNSPTAWSWQFPGAATTSSTQQNPVITYNTPGVYNVSLTASNTNGNNTATKNNYITVIAQSGGSSCDTLTNLLTTDTLALYQFSPPGWGYIGGHNYYGDLGKAQLFTNNTAQQVTGALLYFGVAKTSSNGSINVRVWDATGAGGSPGNILTTQNVLISSITPGQIKAVNFTTPANVTGNFYVGITYTYTAGDTVALYTTTLNSPAPNGGWELQSNSTWYPYSDGTNSYGINTDNAIFAIVCTPSTSVQASFTASPTSVCAGKSVSFTSTSTGNPTSYSWQFPGGTPSVSTQANPTVTYNTPGTYNVILTVSNAGGNNTATQNNYITVKGNPSLTTSVTAVNCFGQSTGSATVNATGSAPFTYNWSGGGTTATITNKPAGSYTVTVTDNQQCSATATANISQPLNALGASVSVVNASCGLANGSATATATGGAGGYNYNWSTGSNAATISNRPAGSYTVTVTDANGCVATASGTITTSTVTFSINLNVTNATCNQNNGGIGVVVPQGQTGFTYQWSNGSTAQFIGNLAPGSYTVTVTNADGCTATATGTVINGGSGITLSFNTVQAGCSQNNGSATVTVNGGNAPYSYLWSNGGTASTISNVGAGSYTVTVTDANNCSQTALAGVSNSGAPTISVSIVSPTCFGLSNGSATAAPTGGNPPYNYNWSTGSTAPAINNMLAGTYLLTITDAAQCKAIQSVTITQPQAIQLNTSSTAASCGNANGSASVTATGGTGNYQYQWSNSGNTATINNLTAGNYNLTVTDGSGCSATATINVAGAGSFTVTTTGTNPTGSTTNDGSAVASVSGGTPPYTYAWSNGQTTPGIYSLSPGVYTVTVSDAAGCSQTQTVTLVISSLSTTAAQAWVKVYPNPASENWQVEIDLTQPSTLYWKLCNLLGQTVQQKQYDSYHQGKETIAAQHLPAGVYMLTFIAGKEEKTIRLIKN